ncbi:hypothetical protein Vid5_gp82 [Pantoea phage vB_PagS_Vid5]|uniref:Uncharacterized protein n=1 Tax=Pantoea phage vB_PagS_Vid5 TaxID=2099652 RepID=A0A2P1CKQ1_9CAUD|nr:hypothetical protein FDJ45_gp073 [Pantoea phage vB_PagS_Vid5]AVJ51837.1 hypothetical protein Vid5_gp82 [Pantoea phage vB_PagS_Vid5]
MSLAKRAILYLNLIAIYSCNYPSDVIPYVHTATHRGGTLNKEYIMSTYIESALDSVMVAACAAMVLSSIYLFCTL